MASLSAHLRETGDHGRLGFRADCPVCREARLFGALSSESVFSHRAQAALATGALAVSLAAPTAGSAQEADSRQEGTVAPHEPGGGRDGGAPSESDAPRFDPGGDTELPFEVDVPQAPPGSADDGSGDSGPLEAEPEVDPDVPLVPWTESEDPTSSPDPETPDAPVAPAPWAAPPETPPPARAPAQERQSAHGPANKPRPGSTDARGGPSDSKRRPARRVAQSTPPAAAPVAPAEQTAPAVELATVAHAEVDQPATSAPPRAGSRFHVVRPGESLWSIARRSLGPDASVARIAREVARLWDLNEDRIGTGDPDLLRVGTGLRLR